jgi:hypothetical protein
MASRSTSNDDSIDSRGRKKKKRTPDESDAAMCAVQCRKEGAKNPAGAQRYLVRSLKQLLDNCLV